MNGTNIATIRQRGQLTIPRKLRHRFPWVRENSVVEIDSRQEEIALKPYRNNQRTATEWEKLWQNIKKVRSYKGKAGGLSKFIAKDRQNH